MKPKNLSENQGRNSVPTEFFGLLALDRVHSCQKWQGG